MNAPAHLNAADQANLIAGKVVAHATAYLDGRNDASELARNARALQIELLGAPSDDPKARPILDVARLLVAAMMGASWAAGEARQDRWQHVMGALVELVRHESNALRGDDVSTAYRAGRGVEVAT
jgi:hypothetical protein